MGLGRGQEREVMSAVGDARRHESETEPQPGCSDVGAEDKWSNDRGKEVAEDVLNRVGIDGCQANRSGPFMVLFVNVLVEPGSMKQTVT